MKKSSGTEIVYPTRLSKRLWIVLLATWGALMPAADAVAEISESKLALIRELLEISGYSEMSEEMGKQQAYVELMRIRASYRPMMEFAVSEQPELSPEDQERLLEKLKDFEAFAEKFQSGFVTRLNFSQIIRDVYHPLYDENFSEDDLAQMVEFYRTPVGRKTISRMPAIMQRATRAIDRLSRPESIRLIQEIVAEQREELARPPQRPRSEPKANEVH